MKKVVNEIAPCGVYCGACPSFQKSCFGCSTDNEQGRRKSRIACKIRVCCYLKKEHSCCFECEEFPCSTIRKKLINSHPEDPKYKYRHELTEIAEQFKKLEFENFLQFQKNRWTCPSCGGVVFFYHYKCGQCGKTVNV